MMHPLWPKGRASSEAAQGRIIGASVMMRPLCAPVDGGKGRRGARRGQGRGCQAVLPPPPLPQPLIPPHFRGHRCRALHRPILQHQRQRFTGPAHRRVDQAAV